MSGVEGGFPPPLDWAIDGEKLKGAYSRIVERDREHVPETASDEVATHAVAARLRATGVTQETRDAIGDIALDGGPKIAGALVETGKACCLAHIVDATYCMAFEDALRVAYELGWRP